jgi:hypothetical protein
MKALIDASKESELEVIDDKDKCIVMSRDQNARRNDNKKTDNKSSEGVQQLKHLAKKPLTDQNSIQLLVKSNLKSGNVCYHTI